MFVEESHAPVEEVRIETRPVIESADTPNQEKNTAEEVPA